MRAGLGVNEEQRIFCFECTGGHYRLSFGGEETEPIPFEGPGAEVKAKLEALTINWGRQRLGLDTTATNTSFISKAPSPAATSNCSA